MLTTIYPFETSNNYTFDSNKIEFSGGEARLKNLTPTDETFYASYNTDINGNRGNGVLTGTAVGGASVSGGKLDLAHNDKRYVDYDAIGNANSQQVGCLRFKVTPNYFGQPDTRWFFAICKAHNDIKNTIELRQSGSNSYLRLHIYDKDGNFVVEHLCGTWNPIVDTEYEFELNWDFTTGATRLFINGVQNGSTCVSTCLRDSNIGLLRIGSDYDNGSGDLSNFKIDDFQVFSTVQHTSNYIPTYVQETLYTLTNPTIVPNSSFLTDSLEEFDAFFTSSGNDAVKYAIRKESTDYYWDGSQWSTSSGYSQSNTAVEIIANITSLDVALGYNVKPVIYLHSDDGSTTPEVDAVSIGYDFHGEEPTNSQICKVWGYIRNAKNEAVADATISTKLSNPKEKISTEFIISKVVVSVTTDASGYFEMELIRSNQFSGVARGYYIFEIIYPNNEVSRFVDIEVPDQATGNFWNLI